MKNKFKISDGITVIFLRRKDGTILGTNIETAGLSRAQEFPNTWYASWNPATQSFYVYGKLPAINGQRQTVQLHRWLVADLNGREVDHFNQDTLDNRCNNLRPATSAENCQNKKVDRRNNKSGLRGVSWCNTNKKWIAQWLAEKTNFSDTLTTNMKRGKKQRKRGQK
jgi:hypothetical protein